MSLSDLINNRGKGLSECSKILGSKGRVHTLGKLYGRHADLFHLMSIHAIMDYAQTEEFSKEEMEAFKTGVTAMGTFMDKCLKEWQFDTTVPSKHDSSQS